MFYKKVLVITDNFYLYNNFKKIVNELNITESSFEYSISTFSQKKLFSNEVKVLDLKNDKDIEYILKKFDIVFSIHCKQIFPKKLVENIKCINVHPGYNPYNRGWYPQVFSIIYNLPIGATIHEIDNDLDNGNIISRRLIEKYDYDTSETLYNRVLEKEIELIYENLEFILNNKYKVKIPEEKGRLYLKKDFNELCKIDLNELCKTKDIINKLRALTHGSFKNAYFYDENTGNKIYIEVKLTPEK